MTVSLAAARACNNWLNACRDLGWRREDMTFLCDLWWEYHDDDGNLFPPGQKRPVVNGEASRG